LNTRIVKSMVGTVPEFSI